MDKEDDFKAYPFNNCFLAAGRTFLEKRSFDSCGSEYSRTIAAFDQKALDVVVY